MGKVQRDTKQVKFKTLFKYSQRRSRCGMLWWHIPDASSGYGKSTRADGGRSDSRNNLHIRRILCYGIL